MSPFAGLAFHPMDGIMQARLAHTVMYRLSYQSACSHVISAVKAVGSGHLKPDSQLWCAEHCTACMTMLQGRKPSTEYVWTIRSEGISKGCLNAGQAIRETLFMLQALPYCWTLFYVPMHFLTHELLLFATGIWTANIHDNLHGRLADVSPLHKLSRVFVDQSRYLKRYCPNSIGKASLAVKACYMLFTACEHFQTQTNSKNSAFHR